MKDLVLFSWKPRSVKKLEKELDAMLASHRARIAARLRRGPPYTWKNFVALLDEMEDERHLFYSPIFHLSIVKKSKSEAGSKAYDRCLEKLSKFSTKLFHNERLYRAFKHLVKSVWYRRLTPEQQVAVDSVLEGFRMAGIGMKPQQKKRYLQISAEIAALETKFSNNLRTATGAWTKLVREKSLLVGIPEAVIAAAEKDAREKQTQGYLFSLGDATFMAVMTNAQNRDLRREFYHAWVARATAKKAEGGT